MPCTFCLEIAFCNNIIISYEVSYMLMFKTMDYLSTFIFLSHLLTLMFIDVEADLKYAVTNTEAVTVALNTLEKSGPDVTYTFMSEMVTMENIYVCCLLFVCLK